MYKRKQFEGGLEWIKDIFLNAGVADVITAYCMNLKINSNFPLNVHFAIRMDW